MVNPPCKTIVNTLVAVTKKEERALSNPPAPSVKEADEAASTSFVTKVAL